MTMMKNISKFNLDDIPRNKTITIPTMTIVVRSILHESNQN